MFNNFKSSNVKTIHPAEAYELAQAGKITLVDVREANEWAEMHVPGAVHAALSTLPQTIATLAADKPIVFYCRSGQRSARAIEVATAAGKPYDTHVAGGILAWRAAGLPVD